VQVSDGHRCPFGLKVTFVFAMRHYGANVVKSEPVCAYWPNRPIAAEKATNEKPGAKAGLLANMY
jgi:hypothetical protein